MANLTLSPLLTWTFILRSWRAGDGPDEIVKELRYFGVELRREHVFDAIRQYIGACTENRTYGRRSR